MRTRLLPQRETLQHILQLFRDITADAEVGRKAVALFSGLCLFLLIISGLNVLNSYVGRDFMTAIADHDRPHFWRYALLTVAVFAALTLVSVLQRYLEETLGLLWRKWLTWRIYQRYADHRVFWRLEDNHGPENPDQRIAEDVRAFTTTTLSFTLMLLNGALTVIAFSGVLWTISPLLFGVALLYASAGTWLTYRLGQPLIRMNYDQLDREAEFRASLIHLRENADQVALSRREDLWMLRSRRHLDELADNFGRIIRVNRTVGFFTTGYNWLIQLIPALFIAPLFIEGRVEFGVITQAALAFTQLLGAFSLIITQFQSISSFAAVVSRLTRLSDAARAAETAERAASAAATGEGQGAAGFGYQHVTLQSPQGKPLISDLSVDFAPGRPVLIHGPDDQARDALFRASAGIQAPAEGFIRRPGLDQALFVSERPYLCPGSLRELFLRPLPERTDTGRLSLEEATLATPERTLRAALKALGLGQLVQRYDGLDSVHDWDSVLSLEEQQLLVIARVLSCKPLFVFLDRPETSLSVNRLHHTLEALIAAGITPVTLAKDDSLSAFHPDRLTLKSGGGWRWQPGQPARSKP